MNKVEVFTVEKENKESVELALLMPDTEIGYRGQMEYNKVFANALKSGALLRQSLNTYLREQKLWDDVKESEYVQLQDIVLKGHEVLERKRNIKLSEAKKIALEMRETRIKLRNLLAERSSLDVNTAEGQAENARFNMLLSLCLVYNKDGKPYYKDLNDYITHSTENVAVEGAKRFAALLWQVDQDYEQNLPENKFLKKYKYVDDKLRLVNKDGHLIDVDGKLIDENGRYINEQGEFVDYDGNLVGEDGQYKEVGHFLDEDGNPIVD